MYHTADYFEGKKSNEIITNKLRNVDGLRDSQSEKKAVLTSFVIKWEEKGQI